MRKLLTQVRHMYARLFYVPSAEQLALRELEEAKRKLLTAQTGREYADAMCKFHEAQIKRLTTYIYKNEESK